MSGKGRKPANRGGGKRSQPAAQRNGGAARSQGSGRTATQPPARTATQPPGRTATQTAGSRPRQAPPAGASAQRSSTAARKPSRPPTYPFRDSITRRKRRQKLIVWIGVGAIIGAGVVTVFLGQLGGKPSPRTAAAATSSAAPASPTAAATTAAAASTTNIAAAPTGPVMVMNCPSGGGASPLFDHQIARATTPYSITITYGDGDKYTDTDQHLGAIFSHTYTAHGTYTVNAVLTDAAKQTAAASCTYTW